MLNKMSYSHPDDGSIFEVTRDSNVSGGWLQGHIDASYTELVLVFGHPTYMGQHDKTKAEWCLKINGTMVTIYDYKQYEVSLDRIRDWHVGGTSVEAFNAVRGALEAARHKFRNRQN